VALSTEILNRETIITNCKNGKQKYIKTIGNRCKTSPNTSIRVTERRIANQGGTILSKNIGRAYNKNMKRDHQHHIYTSLCIKYIETKESSVTSIAIEFPIKSVHSNRC